MELNELARALRDDAVSIVFVNVLLQQLGMPIPAMPTLMLAGSLAAGFGPLGKILAAAVLASAITDAGWYAIGKVFGYRVLAGLCKISINPASCVSQTEARFMRWGVSSLLVAKFIPGFSAVAPPIAGALRMPFAGYLLAATAGSAIWAAVAVFVGWWLRDAVPDLLKELDRNMASATVAVVLALASVVLWKLWQKYRFHRLSAIPHITPDALISALSGQQPPLILDLRGASMVAETGPVSGAVVAEHDNLGAAVGSWPKDWPIVTLCACPNDAGAVLAARRLRQQGFLSVRPLQGGYEAWLVATSHRPEELAKPRPARGNDDGGASGRQ